MKKYLYYLFDFDGTLADTIDSLVDVYVKGFASIGIKTTKEDMPYFLTVSLKEAFQTFCGDFSKWDEFAKNALTIIDDVKTIQLTKLYPETKEVLNTLNDEKCVLSLVTGNTIKHCQKCFDYLNVKWDIFKVMIGMDECHVYKPAPDPLLMAIDKLKIKDKKDVIYIGDSENDAISASRAGIDYILVDRDGKFKNTQYHTIKSLKELLN